MPPTSRFSTAKGLATELDSESGLIVLSCPDGKWPRDPLGAGLAQAQPRTQVLFTRQHVSGDPLLLLSTSSHQLFVACLRIKVGTRPDEVIELLRQCAESAHSLGADLHIQAEQIEPLVPEIHLEPILQKLADTSNVVIQLHRQGG